MDWINNVNDALGYIEHHLDSEISYDELCLITACPISVFQRFFMLATGITLAEYIRRRKLSCAAQDLINTNMKVIDIALKYGYESSDAFCVAFKRLYGLPPTLARRSKTMIKIYYRIFFTLSISYIKGDAEMIIQHVSKYHVCEPLFEGFRIILSHLGEKYTPEYIQGISGAAFKIAGGCPSRPTCIYTMWTTDFIKFMGYEATEYPCFDKDGKDISDKMIDAVKRQIDCGKPALVWNAFTNAEWDVVCGYDTEQEQFIGRGSYIESDEYAREPWNRAVTCDIAPTFGAIIIGEKKYVFNERKAEIDSLAKAIKHARTAATPEECIEGIQFYKKWANEYSHHGKERDAADAYCFQVYSSTRKAAVSYLQEISAKYEKPVNDMLMNASKWFEREVKCLKSASPYLSWESPWGVNEERSKKVAPILSKAATCYENAIGCMEKALLHLGENY